MPGRQVPGAEVYISSHVATFVATRFFFFHAEIFKSGYFMQIYSNQSVLCRNIGQVPLRVTQSCAADYLDRMYMKEIGHGCNVYSFSGSIDQ